MSACVFLSVCLCVYYILAHSLWAGISCALTSGLFKRFHMICSVDNACLRCRSFMFTFLHVLLCKCVMCVVVVETDMFLHQFLFQFLQLLMLIVLLYYLTSASLNLLHVFKMKFLSLVLVSNICVRTVVNCCLNSR